ncbi:MAG: hypothetical protein ACRDBX_02675 [Erysipelotrichaceae bacterium]
MKAKQYLLPFAILLGAALFSRFFGHDGIVSYLVIFAFLFALGYSFNPRSQGKAVLPKVLSILLVTLIGLYELGYLHLTPLSTFLTFFNLEGVWMMLCKVYLGYLFKG